MGFLAGNPERACVNCHFFQKEYPPDNSDTASVRSILETERESTKNQDFSWTKGHFNLKCHHGVWDEGYKSISDKYELLVETDRTDDCFFWPHHPGMLNPAAIELQRRKSEQKEASKDRRLTVWELWIAAIALVIDARFGIGEIIVRWLGSS